MATVPWTQQASSCLWEETAGMSWYVSIIMPLLSSMLGLKGSSGVAPCAVRCWCVGKEKKADADRGLLPITARGENIVDITCAKKADIVLKSDADV